MTPTERTIARLPAHLRRYVVSQDYDAYTPRDQAVWRHILCQLRSHLRDKAHPVYLEGLEATGIGEERIPSLDEMNERLSSSAGRRWACAASSRPRCSPSCRRWACWPSPRTSAPTSTSSTRRRRTSSTRAPATRPSSPTRATPST